MAYDPEFDRRWTPPAGTDEFAPRRPPRSSGGGGVGLLAVGIVVGVGIGIAAFALYRQQQGGATAGPQITETRFKRDDDGFVTATQTMTVPAVGAGASLPGQQPAQPPEASAEDG